jgi:hypothetical protein
MLTIVSDLFELTLKLALLECRDSTARSTTSVQVGERQSVDAAGASESQHRLLG